ALQKQGGLDEALVHFQEAIHLQPDLAEAHLGLGLARLKQDRWEEALACFEQALRSKPDLAEAHYYLGQALLAKGQLAEAVAHFHQLPSIQLNASETDGERSSATKKPGRWRQASGLVRQSPEPTSPEAQAQLQRAVFLSEQGHLDEAVT